MLFVRTQELKPGMRLARPVYNKNGVLLYERDTKLTMQGVISIKNFNLIGIFILEPAEPVPPMSSADVEFERFQTMSVFSIKAIFESIEKAKKVKDLPIFVSNILKDYGRLEEKINFVQNLRSKEDESYKHCLNTAILAALISHKMALKSPDQIKVIMAAVLHEAKIESFNMDEEVRRIILQMNHKMNADSEQKKFVQVGRLSEVLAVACTYDYLTAMKLDEEPSSEVEALRYLINEENNFSQEAVKALIDSINILSSGVCVELTNGEKGLVLVENKMNILRPMVLNFRDNRIIYLEDDLVFKRVQIKDIMKSMDNRVIMDNGIIEATNYKHTKLLDV